MMFRRARKSPARSINSDEENPELRRTLPPERARERTMQRAVKLLAAKPRAVEELRERLLEKEWATAEVVDEVIGKLKQHGYLNDERFAFGYASYRVRQKPLGRQRLARDLQMKKVDADTARDALDVVYTETSEDELIDRAINKRVALRGRPATRAETKSLFDYLLRLGFSPDLIMRKIKSEQ